MSVRNQSPESTWALGVYVCLRVWMILQLQDPTLSLSPEMSCRDLPVFSFPLEVFPHTNKAQPARWNKEEAAFVQGADTFRVFVYVHSWPWLTVCYMQIYFWACNSGCCLVLFAHKPTVPWEWAYFVSHSQNKFVSCLPLINR